MTLRIGLVLALGSLAVACSSGGGSGSSNGTSSGASTGQSPTGSGDGPEYTVSCSGEVAAKPSSLELDLDVAPRCVGGEPGTFCADPDGGSCNAEDVAFSYAPPAFRCPSTTIYAWDGKACVGHSTASDGGALRCKGKDCQKIFKSKEACEEAHAACIGK